MSTGLWGLGDYAAVAAELQPAADVCVARCGPLEGARVLDVGAGTGNAAAAAQAAGAASVVAVEPEEALVAAGRERLPGIDWLVGSASALPVPDASFDAVVSVFGAVFDPDHPAVASEFARVCRPGGVVALTAWVPGGAMAAAASALSRGAPGPPPDGPSPISWSDEAYVRSALEPHGFAVSASVESLVFSSPSVEARVEREESVNPFWVATRDRLGPAWPERRAEAAAALAAGNEAPDGSFRATSSYLLAAARR